MAIQHSKAPGVAKSLIIAAGLSLPYNGSGTQFYIITATAPLLIKPVSNNGAPAGNENLYGNGQGQFIAEGFDWLEIKNPTSNPIVVVIFTGGDDFIDKRLIIDQTVNPQVAYPTYPDIAAALTEVPIPDISGQEFTDINGVKWIAISRVAVIVCNEDTAFVYRLQKSGATVITDPAVASIYPRTSLRYDARGNFAMANDGATPINCIVSEIYQAVLKT